MKFLASAVSLLAAAVSAVQAVSVSGPRLLAVLDDLADKEAYSTFLGDLEGRFPNLLTVAWLNLALKEFTQPFDSAC